MIDILITSDFSGHRVTTIHPGDAAYGFLRDFTSVGDTVTIQSVGRRLTTKWEILKKHPEELYSEEYRARLRWSDAWGEGLRLATSSRGGGGAAAVPYAGEETHTRERGGLMSMVPSFPVHDGSVPPHNRGTRVIVIDSTNPAFGEAGFVTGDTDAEFPTRRARNAWGSAVGRSIALCDRHDSAHHAMWVVGPYEVWAEGDIVGGGGRWCERCLMDHRQIVKLDTGHFVRFYPEQLSFEPSGHWRRQ